MRDTGNRWRVVPPGVGGPWGPHYVERNILVMRDTWQQMEGCASWRRRAMGPTLRWTERPPHARHWQQMEGCASWTREALGWPSPQAVSPQTWPPWLDRAWLLLQARWSLPELEPPQGLPCSLSRVGELPQHRRQVARLAPWKSLCCALDRQDAHLAWRMVPFPAHLR